MENKATKRYVTRDAEAGNIIERFDTIEEARKAIESYEEQDKAEDVYTPNFYEIYDTKNETVVR